MEQSQQGLGTALERVPTVGGGSMYYVRLINGLTGAILADLTGCRADGPPPLSCHTLH
jgi:hypothetical protein